ncbi:hypothetical protein PoB_006038500 [Plakobranchus ocellatus]|uniref:Uncharacterized protein n=1 Tax=Plakobranchus ocellatus TaxID=259542 RepID=A0AAV4CPT1_9GAST|nr:hypothetical protein PoB_006038500 [Plakobranchus ocellatus]
MRVLVWSLLILCVLDQVSSARDRRRRRRPTCVTEPRLRDKWHIVGENKRVSIRIRSNRVVYRHGAKVIKYRCLENRRNIYLLRKPKYEGKNDGIICLAFSYVADHPRGEYAIIRLIGQGQGSFLMSPVLVPRRAKLSIDSTCDLEGRHTRVPSKDHYVTRGFMRRSVQGCKFPKAIQGRWNFTYQHAKSLEIWQRNSTLHLMDGSSVRFMCDKRDGSVFVFRSRRFVSADEDAIMCVEFTPMEDDPFYSFQLSRHNSGKYLDGQLKPVSKSDSVYIHIDCDWMGSPARPEFLYP